MLAQARTVFLLSALFLVFSNCGDNTLTHNAGSDDDPYRERPAYNPSAADAGTINPDTGTIPDDDRCCVLVPASGTDLSVGYEGTLDLGVYLFSLGSGNPMADELIEWSLEGDALGGTRLSAATSFTIEDGLANIRFEAGTTPAVFAVRASHPGANAVEFEVEVLDLPVGTIAVNVSHPSASIYNVSPITVRLYPRATLSCAFLAPGAYPADYFVQSELESTSDQAVFENILVEESFTVVATGFGEIGEIAAQGCLDDVFVMEGETREIEVVLQLLPLNPVGEYDVESWWDFSDALAETGTVGEIILDILYLFEDPGDALINYMIDALDYFVGGIIATVVEIFLDVTSLDRIIADAINTLIQQSETLTAFMSVGCDLRRMITRLQILSILSIGKVGSDFEVFGIDTWNGLGVCDFTPDPDFIIGECDEAPDCERLQIEIEDGSLGLLRGDWTGRVLSYNRLDIDRHAVDFNYGRLILFVLETYIFPFLTGDEPPVTLEDVMVDIINCPGIADFIGDICLGGSCVTEDDIENFCGTAVGLVFGTLFEVFVGALSFDSVLELRGTVTLVNTDTDLEIEELVDGEYTGTIFIDAEGSPFTATFEGVRME